MLDELQSRWQNLTPEMQAYVYHGALALAALLGGHFAGKFFINQLLVDLRVLRQVYALRVAEAEVLPHRLGLHSLLFARGMICLSAGDIGA